MTVEEQRFEIGFAMNTWDFGNSTLEKGFAFLHETGFRSYEALLGDTLTLDQARLYHRVGGLRHATVLRDYELLARLAKFSRAETDFGLNVASLYVNPHWIEPGVWPAELDVITAIARFLRGCGSQILVTGGGPPARVGRHDADGYRAFAASLEQAGAETANLGIRLVYHPHLDCFVENREELDRLMDVLDTTNVGLCIDPAHLQATGSDPLDALRTYRDHVDYVHFKDWRGQEGADGIDRYAFVSLGEGYVDLPGLTELLLESRYDGTVVIEVDSIEKPPEQSCLECVEYVTKTLGLELVPAVAATA